MPTGNFMRSTIALKLVTAGLIATLAQSAAAQDISDKSVEAFMEYAWSMTPTKFTKPSGTVVEINKKDREQIIVPVDSAREIIRAGRLTAHAQLCDLPKEQVLNFRSLMKREFDKKKWSEQQMIYVNQLHLTTVMLLTGKIQLVEQEGGGKAPAVVEEAPSNNAKSCSEEQRGKVKTLIDTYVKAGPPVSLDEAEAAPGPTATAPAAATPAAATTATQAPAPPAAATPAAAKKP